MKPLIISIRGTHMDDLPATAISELIKTLSKQYPDVPVTLCYETDPNNSEMNSVDQIKKTYKEKIDLGRSRYPDKPYSQDEVEHDKSIFRLMQTVNVFKVNFRCSDLAGISQYPLGDPRVEEKRAEREKQMADTCLQAAREVGGIVIDFGGMSHTEGMQACLKEASDVETAFFWIYSTQGQKYMRIEDRMLQFGAIPMDRFPLDLCIQSESLVEVDIPESKSNTPFLAELTKQLEQRKVLYKQQFDHCQHHINRQLGAGASGASAAPDDSSSGAASSTMNAPDLHRWHAPMAPIHDASIARQQSELGWHPPMTFSSDPVIARQQSEAWNAQPYPKARTK